MLCGSILSYGQSITTIRDELSGLPIPGVVLLAKNGSFRAISDEAGSFQVGTEALRAEDILIFSHVAYQTTSVSWKNLQQNQVIFLIPSNRLLGEIQVYGFGAREDLLVKAGGISQAGLIEISRGDKTTLLEGINSLSGVRMEERAPGSYRIAVRGSQLRSPFGVRNVKFYWNDIPLTDPTGSTSLNQVDVTNVGSIEVIKGPASSAYGAGMGGAIIMESRLAPYGRVRVTSENTVGSYGVLRSASGVEIGRKKFNGFVKYTRQQSDGYRSHSELSRDNIQFFGRFAVNEKQTVSAGLLYTDLFYELPGGLNKTQFDDDPIQARPGSESQNASIDTQTLRLNLSHDYHSDAFSNRTSAYYLTEDFKNPFNTDFKDEDHSGFGGRTNFQWDLQGTAIPIRMSVGGEAQSYFADAGNYGNVGGQRDTIRFQDRLRIAQYFLFGQLEGWLGEQTKVSLGASLNYLRYDIDRIVDEISGQPSRIIRTFEPVLAPRLALVEQISDFGSLHASISYGFSPPTIAEVRTNEGSINEGLKAEEGVNYELGFRGSYLQTRLQLNTSIFYFGLSNAITSEATPTGVIVFRNAGSTNQFGTEVEGSFQLTRAAKASRFPPLLLTTAYTFHHFKFSDYDDDGNDLSGNWLTGVPQNVLFLAIDLNQELGFYGNLNFNYTDRIPLSDDNSVWASGFSLVNAKLGWKTQQGQLEIDVFAGSNNILDRRDISRGNDLNAFGSRYYQPAAGRTFYAGLRLGLTSREAKM